MPEKPAAAADKPVRHAKPIPIPPVAASASEKTLPLRINGKAFFHNGDVEMPLLWYLRDVLRLTGTKFGCGIGYCGACTVLVDGKAVYSCSQLAVWMDGRTVQTIEGLASATKLDPLQEAFIEHDAPQCGYCTSGQLMAAKAVLNENPKPTRDQVRAGMAGNICRCSNYNHYVEAVMAATGAPARTGGAA